MPNDDVQREIVEFCRGGEDFRLEKSIDKFIIKLKNDEVLEGVSEKFFSGMDFLSILQYLHRYPGNRGSVFYCPGVDCEDIMKQIRGLETVQYCSHVLQGSSDHGNLSGEIGLDNKLFVEFQGEPSEEIIKAIQDDFYLEIDWAEAELPECMFFVLTGEAKINPIKIRFWTENSKFYNFS